MKKPLYDEFDRALIRYDSFYSQKLMLKLACYKFLRESKIEKFCKWVIEKLSEKLS
jgi:hypothetical protein